MKNYFRDLSAYVLKNVYDHIGIYLITVALEICSHCGIIVMFNVKYMTLESINDSIFCLTYILYVAPFALQTIYEIVTLACAFSYCVVGCIILRFVIFPDWESLVQH